MIEDLILYDIDPDSMTEVEKEILYYEALEGGDVIDEML